MLAAALAVTSVAALTARADDGSIETVGGAVHLMNTHSSVRMVSEKVRARVTPDLIEVDCEFVMKNEGPADTVLVGFPDGAIGPYQGGGEEYEIQSFRSWVDGAEVKCRRIPDAGGIEAIVTSWWTKKVTFPTGGVRKIRDHYTVSPSWHPNLAGQADSEEVVDRSFQYILWTGASWKGNIGSADIVATVDGIPLERITGTTPLAHQSGNSFRWTLRNFEPGSDGAPESIELSWRLPSEAVEKEN